MKPKKEKGVLSMFEGIYVYKIYIGNDIPMLIYPKIKHYLTKNVLSSKYYIYLV